MSNLIKKNFWQSSNFWTYTVVLIGSLMVGFSNIEGVINETIASIFGLIASAGIIRNFVKDGIGWNWSRIWDGTGNFWGYLAMLLGTIFAIEIPPEALEYIERIISEIVSGEPNLSAILNAVISLVIILVNLFKTYTGGKKVNIKVTTASA